MSRKLWEQKLALFQKLSSLSAKMAEFTLTDLVEKDKAIEQFQSLLHEREAIIAQIDHLALEISDLADNSTFDSSELQQEIRAEAKQIELNNEKIEAVAKTALIELRDKTKKAQEGRQSNRAYDARAPLVEGAFIDKRR